jgi:hypothetical protein
MVHLLWGSGFNEGTGVSSGLLSGMVYLCWGLAEAASLQCTRRVILVGTFKDSCDMSQRSGGRTEFTRPSHNICYMSSHVSITLFTRCSQDINISVHTNLHIQPVPVNVL